MEKMEVRDKKYRKAGNPKWQGIYIALLLIAAGLTVVGRNLGYIDPGVYRIIISWQMLLVALGVMSFLNRQVEGGILLTGVGLFFLIPLLTGAGNDWIRTYWPLIFVVAGIMMIYKMFIPRRKKEPHTMSGNVRNYSNDGGYVVSETVFGSLREIMLDEVFRGADLRITFGGTVLDLTRTRLPEGDTFIDINSTFGGLELHIPDSWKVVTDLRNVLAGCEDKRPVRGTVAENGPRLVIRGNLTFSGIEIRN